MEQYFAFTGAPCFVESKFPMMPNCACSDCAIFTGCCLEKLFQKSTSCTDPQFSNYRSGCVVFDTCTKSMDALIEKLSRINDIAKGEICRFRIVQKE